MVNYQPINSMPETKNEYKLWQAQLNDYIIGVNWNYTNEYLIVASSCGLITSFNSESSIKIYEIKAHQNRLMNLAVSPNENKFVTTGQDGLIKLWDGKSGELLKEIKSENLWTEHALWSPDGNYFAIGSGNVLSIFDNDGNIIQDFEGHESTVSGIVWNNNSKIFATSCYGGVRLFEIHQDEPIDFLEWKNSMHSISWSPDSKFIGCGTQDSKVHFFPLPYQYGSDFEMSGYRGKVKILDWTYDSNYFLTNCWDEIVIWKFAGESPQGQVPLTLSRHSGKIAQAKFQNKSSILASGDDLGFVHFYDAKIGEKTITSVKLENTISKICWSNDDKLLAIGTSNGEIIIMKSPI